MAGLSNQRPSAHLLQVCGQIRFLESAMVLYDCFSSATPSFRQPIPSLCLFSTGHLCDYTINIYLYRLWSTMYLSNTLCQLVQMTSPVPLALPQVYFHSYCAWELQMYIHVIRNVCYCFSGLWKYLWKPPSPTLVLCSMVIWSSVLR
jgi:hypothetical protein